MSKSLAIICLTTCCAVRAAPVHLECSTLNRPSNSWISYTIALDEGARTAIFSESTNGAGTFTLLARFARKDVRFTWYNPVLKLVIDYRIVRENLKFSRSLRIAPNDVDYGTCKILAPADG